MVTINEERVRAFAEKLKIDGNVASALDFYHTFDGTAHDSAMYPALNDPEAVNFFFLACLHQHGFWQDDEHGYTRPMFAQFGGKQVKGSDAVWMALKRALDNEPDALSPIRFAAMELGRFQELFSDDFGPIPFPDMTARLNITRLLGQWFVSMGETPASLVRSVNRLARPLGAFLDGISSHFRPMADLPFRKKAQLLAMALMNRPEKFLKPAPGEKLGPIVDYHLMRVSLRLGLIELDESAARRNSSREWVDATEEHAIRLATFQALEQALKLSGVTPETLDFALWSARRYCPEMEQPNCGKCRFESTCAKRTELFQPVYRTTAY